MKRVLLAILTGALTVCLGSAQDTSTPQNGGSTQEQPSAHPSTPQETPGTQQNPTTEQPTPPSSAAPANPAAAGIPRIAPGSVIPVQLAKSIDVKKAKTGDEVIAKVTQDLKNNNGEVVVPKDTKVVGHVTEAQARNKEQKESELGIAFDHAVTKSGEMQMPMSIQAVIAAPNANSSGGSGSTNEQSNAAPTTAAPAGGMSPAAGRNAGTGGAPPNTPTAGDMPSDAASNTSARPQITGSTLGVIGISNLTLSAAPDAAQGSLLSSDKNNVKLENGTMMLLRINQ